MGLCRAYQSHTKLLAGRSGDIIEPMLTPQWWMNCDELAVKSCEAVNRLIQISSGTAILDPVIHSEDFVDFKT